MWYIRIGLLLFLTFLTVNYKQWNILWCLVYKITIHKTGTKPERQISLFVWNNKVCVVKHTCLSENFELLIAHLCKHDAEIGYSSIFSVVRLSSYRFISNADYQIFIWFESFNLNNLHMNWYMTMAVVLKINDKLWICVVFLS